MAAVHKRKKAIVIKIHGESCYYCGKDLAGLEITVDHFLAKANGGNNAINNLVPSCRCCNETKSDLYIEDFRLVQRLNLSRFRDIVKPHQFLELYKAGAVFDLPSYVFAYEL